MKSQSNLGERVVYKHPAYNETQIGRVTNTGSYKKYGIIDVVFLDHSQPYHVWVTGDREPAPGDMVLVGFIQGRSDAPYMLGIIRNESITSNFIVVNKSKITIQFPADSADSKGHLLDDGKKSARMKLEIDSTGVKINGLYAARLGDTVQVSVSVPEHGSCSGTGTITSGANSSGSKA